MEHAMYELLRERMPDCAVVSVGHRSSLQKFHAVTYRLSPASAEVLDTEPQQPESQVKAIAEPVD